MAKSSERVPLISVLWKKTALNVNLYEKTWYGHILPRHSESMRGKVSLIKVALQHCLNSGDVVQWLDSPEDEWFVQYRCPHFEPYNYYLLVSIKILDRDTAIVTSAYPIKELVLNKEVRKYESSQ